MYRVTIVYKASHNIIFHLLFVSISQVTINIKNQDVLQIILFFVNNMDSFKPQGIQKLYVKEFVILSIYFLIILTF